MGFSALEGTGSSGVLALAESLGSHEEQAGLPLRPQAAAGSVFARALKLAGVARESLLITNVIRCRPPNNELLGMPFEHQAVEACEHYFREALASHPGIKVVLALGQIPHRTMTGLSGSDQSNTKMRGYVLQASEYAGLVVISTYHPSFIQRGAGHLFRVLVEDIRRAVEVARQLQQTRTKVEWRTVNGAMCRVEVPVATELPFILNPVDDSRLAYQTDPTVEDARRFRDECWRNPEKHISVDVETAHSAALLEGEDEEDKDNRLTLFQASLAPWTGIAMPPEGAFLEIAKEITALPNPKVGHNFWAFDLQKLHWNGFVVNGVIDDTLFMWKALQPGLPADLQFVASWFGMSFPWKHLSGSQFRFYGCADVDAPLRILAGLPAAMRKVGVWDTYVKYVRGLRPVLDAMTARGVGVDRDQLVAFGKLLQETIAKVRAEIMPLVPAELQAFDDYKGVPKDVREFVAKRLPAIEVSIKDYWPVGVKMTKKALAETLAPQKAALTELGFESLGYERRNGGWSKPKDFNPGSWQQVMSYAKFKRHQIPVVSKKKNGQKVREESVNEKALLQLSRRTKDPFYKLILDYREPSKMLGTYVGDIELLKGGFMPGPDGRVRADFTTRPANGQLSTRNGPPLQTCPAHGELAPAFQRCLVAAPGHRIVSLDWKSFHILTLGLEAKDATYMRLARIDMHSFFTTQLLGLERPDALLAQSDDELRERLGWWKKQEKTYQGPKGRALTFKNVRDQQAKPTILGYGLGMGAHRLWEENEDYIANKVEAQKLIDMLERLFPLEVKYRRAVRELAHRQHYLMSRYKFIRWFWNVMQWNALRQQYEAGPDSEAAISHYVQNDAFGMMRDVMLECHDQGWDERYWLTINKHDALEFDCPDQYVDECIDNIKSLMERPSMVLADPVVAPQGLWCQVEVKVGRNGAEMEEIKI